METSFLELRKKDVVNVKDGKKLGRISDTIFTYPEGRVMGFIAPGGKWFCFTKTEVFIDIRNIVRIGFDTVLVDISPVPRGDKKQKCDYGAPPPKNDRRSYDEYE